MKPGYFITGTDTGVGKTVVSALLVREFARQGRQVAGLKPVASGCELTAAGLRNEDAVLLQACSSLELPYESINPFAFKPAIAPHVAASRTNVMLKSENLVQKVNNIRELADIVIVEGVGGWMVPLNESETMADFARALSLPVILVVGMRLGCINHALMASQAIHVTGLELSGWVANQVDPEFCSDSSVYEANVRTINGFSGAPCLCEIPYQDALLNSVTAIDEIEVSFANNFLNK